MPKIGIFRPIAKSHRRECDRLASPRSRILNAAALVLALVAAVPAQAQNDGATGSAPHATVTVKIGTSVAPILMLRRVGTTERLDDGRYEQRYEIIANVAFRFVNVAEGARDVRCANETREVALAQFEGVPGYRTEIRLRSTDATALDVSLEAHTAITQPSGR